MGGLNSGPAENDGGESPDLMSSGVVGARSGSPAHVMLSRRLAVGSPVSGAGRGATGAYRCVVRALLRFARTVRSPRIAEPLMAAFALLSVRRWRVRNRIA